MKEFFGVVYEPKFQDFKSEEDFRIAQDSLYTILASSLNVEMVYIVLKSVTAFSKEKIQKRDLQRESEINLCDVSGIFITRDERKMNKFSPALEIEMRAHAQEFKRQVNEEIDKKRHLIL